MKLPPRWISAKINTDSNSWGKTLKQEEEGGGGRVENMGTDARVYKH